MLRRSSVCRRVVLRVGFWAVVTAAWCGIRTAADDAKTPPAGLRVFYTGHSFHMFVPPEVEQLVKSAHIQGHKLVGQQGIGYQISLALGAFQVPDIFAWGLTVVVLMVIMEYGMLRPLERRLLAWRPQALPR